MGEKVGMMYAIMGRAKNGGWLRGKGYFLRAQSTRFAQCARLSPIGLLQRLDSTPLAFLSPPRG